MQRKQQTCKNDQTFLTKFMKIMKQLNKVSEKSVIICYGLVKDDLQYELDEKAKNRLFVLMKDVYKVQKVEKAPLDCCCFIGLIEGNSDCFIGLYKGNGGEELTKQAQDYAMERWLINLEDQEESDLIFENSSIKNKTIPLSPNDSLLNLDDSLPQQRIFSNGNYQNHERIQPNQLNNVHQRQFLNQGIPYFESQYIQKPNEETYSPVQNNNFESIRNSQNRTSSNLQTSNKTMNKSGQKIMTKDQELEIEYVLKVLKDTLLHSEKAIKEFGEIKYSEFFLQLIDKPENEKHKRWIGNFLDKFSDRWSHPCLKVIRDYFRKYRDFYVSR